MPGTMPDTEDAQFNRKLAEWWETDQSVGSNYRAGAGRHQN